MIPTFKFPNVFSNALENNLKLDHCGKQIDEDKGQKKDKGALASSGINRNTVKMGERGNEKIQFRQSYPDVNHYRL